MPDVLIVQHAGCEPPGTIGDVLTENNTRITTIRTDLGDVVPTSIDGFGGLVIMGGSMAVYEQDQHPFLTDEINLINSAVASSVPILGICLGGQLVSAALGGDVYKGEKKEIGWLPLYITQDAADDPLFRDLPSFAQHENDNFVGFTWHGDYFTLPDGAVRLAYSDLCECQAIRYGANVYALQFHPEISDATVCVWLEEFAEDFKVSGLHREVVIRDTATYANAQTRAAKELTQRWFDLLPKTP